jgi:hypothetical protein
LDQRPALSPRKTPLQRPRRSLYREGEGAPLASCPYPVVWRNEGVEGFSADR